MTNVKLEGLTRRFGDVTAVDELSLEVTSGEMVALLGPSGCGKSTTLRMITGLLVPTAGDVLFDGKSMLTVPTERRGAVMVFQKHLLFPTMNVAQNVGFGLRMQGVAKKEIDRRVSEMLDLVQLSGFEQRRAHELSGGQQQRVALARALVVRPKVLLLDEPLANLDANLRLDMRALIRSIQRELAITAIFVTHDQEEAVMLADRVALLFDGKLQQYDLPQAFYQRPRSRRIARFFRNENVLPGHKVGNRVETALGSFTVSAAAAQEADGAVLLTVRPEDLVVSPPEGTPNQLPATVETSVYMGTYTQLQLRLGEAQCEAQWQVNVPVETEVPVGSAVTLALPPNKSWVFASTDAV